MRKAFISSLIKASKHNKKIMLLTGDLGFRYLEPFRDAFPDRFINVGVAESNLVSVAAGLAAAGYEPFVYSIATFASLRAFEQIRNLIVLQNLNVKIVGTGGGLAYAGAGPTHHSQEDIALMRLLPGVVIAAPSHPQETEQVVSLLVNHKGPAYLRLERNPTNSISTKGPQGIGKGYIHSTGKTVAFLSTGTKLELAIAIANELKKKKIYPTVASFPFIAPLDGKLVRKLVRTHTHIVTFEEHRITGGFGSAIEHYHPTLLKLGLRDSFSTISGGYETLLVHHGLDIKSCLKAINKYLKSD